MYFEVPISGDGREVSYVRKETLLALYIRAKDEKEAREKLELFKRLFPHPTYAKPKKLWTIVGWMIFTARPHVHDVVWNIYRWECDTTFFCSVGIAYAQFEE